MEIYVIRICLAAHGEIFISGFFMETESDIFQTLSDDSLCYEYYSSFVALMVCGEKVQIVLLSRFLSKQV